MPHSKKPKHSHEDDDANAAAAASFNILSTDEMAMIFGCLGPVDILPLTRVCRKWADAGKKTIVPLTKFRVNDVGSYGAMVEMSTALPMLQSIELGHFSYSRSLRQRYAVGEDPHEENSSDEENVVVHDISPISNFTQLRVLELSCASSLNGKYPFLFNFQLLEKLKVSYCDNLKLDLKMLAGMPLQELDIFSCKSLTGNLSSLSALKNTLETVDIMACPQIEGSFMGLSKFPHLKSLKLSGMDLITGDVRDIGENDFPKLETLFLPEKVCGGHRNEIMSISDAKDLISAIYSIKNQRGRPPSLFEGFHWNLSKESPEWYREEWEYPFSFRFVRAGSRLGWRWEVKHDYTPDYCFEVKWLDPIPEKGSAEYQSFIQALVGIQSHMEKYPFFKGYHEPPSEQVYNRLLRMYRPSREEMEIYENL